MQAGFKELCLLCCLHEACVGNTSTMEQGGVDAATFPRHPWPEPVTAQDFALVWAKGHPAWWHVLVKWLYGLFRSGGFVVSFVCVGVGVVVAWFWWFIGLFVGHFCLVVFCWVKLHVISR